MASTLVIEVGKISIVQAGMLGPPGVRKRVDPGRLTLLVLNDPADVRYEVTTASSNAPLPIKPNEEPEDCCLIAATSDTPMQRVMELCPRRVIGGHVAHQHMWPREWFQSADAQTKNAGADGPYRTSFALIAHDYAWSWEMDRGDATYTFDLPSGIRLFKALRRPKGDECDEFLSGQAIEHIRLARAKKEQQNTGGEGWPP